MNSHCLWRAENNLFQGGFIGNIAEKLLVINSDPNSNEPVCVTFQRHHWLALGKRQSRFFEVLFFFKPLSILVIYIYSLILLFLIKFYLFKFSIVKSIDALENVQV